jgi:hypothetical protein
MVSNDRENHYERRLDKNLEGVGRCLFQGNTQYSPELKINTKTSVRIASNPAKIPTRYLQKTTLERYCSISLFGDDGIRTQIDVLMRLWSDRFMLKQKVYILFAHPVLLCE